MNSLTFDNYWGWGAFITIGLLPVSYSVPDEMRGFVIGLQLASFIVQIVSGSRK